jgi:hypothetical protein
VRRIYRWGNNAITLEDNSIEIDTNKRATTTHTSTKKTEKESKPTKGNNNKSKTSKSNKTNSKAKPLDI